MIDNGQIEKFREKFPTLQVMEKCGALVVSGYFELRAKGNLIDGYLIKVEIQKNFPISIPKVYEVGERIPRQPDFHTSDDGSLCLFVDEEKDLFIPITSTLIDFFEGPLTNHLLQQFIRETEGKYPRGEMRHRAEGIIDFYKEHFCLSRDREVLGVLDILKRPQVKGRDACICGSGEKLKSCHIDVYLGLKRKFDIKFFEDRYKMVKDYFEKKVK